VTEAEEIASQLRAWREDPVSFVWDNFKEVPDQWQEDALLAFVSDDPDKVRIALSACAGPGKSCCIAWCALLFISCYCGEKHPIGYVISETRDLLRDTLWKEISIWLNKSEYLSAAFTVTNEKVYANDHPKDWFLAAKTYAKSANEDEQGRTLSGQHSSHIAYFIDESGDMSVAVLKGAEQGLGNCVFGKIMTAGNPTSHTGLLHFAAVEDDDWYVIVITGDPEDPKRSPRIGLEHAQKMIDKFGRDDAWVMAYILGQFPKTAINTLLTADEVRASINLGKQSKIKESLYNHSQKRLGVDVALYGDDMTVIFPRQGLRAFNPVEMRNTASEDDADVRIAARVLEAKDQWGSELEFIDCTGGHGQGVFSRCQEAGGDPIKVVYSNKASNSEKYFNKRAEMYFRLRDWVRGGGILPNCPKLIKGLSSMTYTMKKGRLILEDKAMIKMKLRRSPDHEDSLAETFAMPEQSSDLTERMPGVTVPDERASSDWDPFG